MCLLTQTSKLLDECPLSIPFIADEFGCSVGYLNNIKTKSGDPGVLKLEELNKWLVEERKHRIKQGRKGSK